MRDHGAISISGSATMLKSYTTIQEIYAEEIKNACAQLERGNQ